MFLNLREIEELARAKVPKPAFDYIAGGGGDEVTLRANVAAWKHWSLRQRVMIDVSKRDASTTVLGERISFPAMVAPTAFHRLVHEEGEKATARAAHQAGTLMMASTIASTPLEEIAAAAPGPKWFQLYVYKDRALTESLVARAKAAGYKALVLTVDVAVQGRRERDARNAFSLPQGVDVANFRGSNAAQLPAVKPGESGLMHYIASQLDPSLTWADLAWLKRVSGMPIVVKGVMTGEDAALAVEHGAAAVVVSNHGGRQLDATVGTAEALPEVVEAVAEASARRRRTEGASSAAGGRAEVYVDGGIRRGTDVLKALALGARAVLVGRPVIWGLALDGAEGAARALQLLREEFDTAMALCGVRTVAEITRDAVRPGAPAGA